MNSSRESRVALPSDNAHAPTGEQGVTTDEQRVGVLFENGSEDRVEFTFTASVQN